VAELHPDDAAPAPGRKYDAAPIPFSLAYLCKIRNDAPLGASGSATLVNSLFTDCFKTLTGNL
jgi:hypothetical protein